MKAVNHLFILDSSGSMTSIKSQIIDLFNGQVGLIREKAKETGIPSFVSLVIFGGSGPDWMSTRLMLASPDDLALLTNETYDPAMGTPLYDAIGFGAKETEDALKYYFYSTDVIVNIFTDGEENASSSFSGNQISTLIKEYQEDYGWQFNYFGANHDVEKFARDHNIDVNRTFSYSSNNKGVMELSETVSLNTASYYINR